MARHAVMLLAMALLRFASYVPRRAVTRVEVMRVTVAERGTQPRGGSGEARRKYVVHGMSNGACPNRVKTLQPSTVQRGCGEIACVCVGGVRGAVRVGKCVRNAVQRRLAGSAGGGGCRCGKGVAREGML